MSERLRVAIAGCHRMLTRRPASHNWAAGFAAVPETPEPREAGPAIVADLAAAVRSGGSTACDVAGAYRASAIGFAIHASSAAGGRRLALDEVDRTLRIPSFPWGNE